MDRKEIVKLNILKTGNDGEGIAYLNNQPIYIYGAAEGEEIEAEIEKNNRGALVGKILKIIQKSPKRAEVLASFSETIGLPLIHLTYPATLEYKYKKIVFHVKGKLRKHINPKTFKRFEGASNPLNYRNETTVLFKQINKVIEWGLYKPNTNLVEPTDNLISQDVLITSFLNYLKNVLNEVNFPVVDKKTSGLFAVSVRKATNSDLAVNLHVYGEHNYKALINLIYSSEFSLKQFGVFVYKDKTTKQHNADYRLLKGQYFFNTNFLNKSYYITANSFFQLNYHTFQSMINYIKDFKIFKPTDILLDAFSGVGVFGLELANKVKEVYCVELVKDQVLALKKNIYENKVPNTKAVVSNVLTWVDYKKHDFDVMLFDPPRTGLCETVCKFICTKKPRNVVYVSCNVETLVKDLKMLAEEYEITSIKGFDMFPYTAHVETVALLTKKSNNS